MSLPDRYASGFMLWRSEHPRSRAQQWAVQKATASGGECVACRASVVSQRTMFRHHRSDAHAQRCPVACLYTVRVHCVRWLCALPEVTDDALPWLRALPQQDQDVVVVVRAEL